MKKNSGLYRSAVGNLMRMAQMQQGAFSVIQAKARGVSKDDLDELENAGLIESFGGGFFLLTEEGKQF